MSARRLGRVALLYGQVERVRLAELHEAALAVAEAERLRAAGEAACLKSRGEGRAALARGEGMAWRLAEGAAEAAELTVERAAAWRQEREAARVGAGEAYRASRLRTEQVTRVVEALRDAEAVLEGRREQAANDDRYGARLCWTRMKAG